MSLIFKSAEDKADPGRHNRNGFIVFLAIIALICVVEYARAMPVWFNPEKAPAHIGEAIERVSWSWSERTGEDFHYAGDTELTVQKDSAVVRYENAEHFQAMVNSEFIAGYTRRWAYQDGTTYGYELVLNSDLYREMSVSNMRTLTHEFGHLLDLPHSKDYGAIMSGIQFQRPLYALSMADYQGFSGSMCHAELTREFDIYIPDIQGQRVSLIYQGGETWKLSTLSDNAATIGCNVSEYQASSGALLIRDLRGFDGSYTAEFVQISDDAFRLGFATSAPE